MLPQVETPIAHTHETHHFSAPEFPLLSKSLDSESGDHKQKIYVASIALQEPLQLEITQHKFGSLDSESGDHKQNKYVAKFALSHQCAGAEDVSGGSQAQQLQ